MWKRKRGMGYRNSESARESASEWEREREWEVMISETIHFCKHKRTRQFSQKHLANQKAQNHTRPLHTPIHCPWKKFTFIHHENDFHNFPFRIHPSPAPMRNPTNHIVSFAHGRHTQRLAHRWLHPVIHCSERGASCTHARTITHNLSGLNFC